MMRSRSFLLSVALLHPVFRQRVSIVVDLALIITDWLLWIIFVDDSGRIDILALERWHFVRPNPDDPTVVALPMFPPFRHSGWLGCSESA